MKRIFMLFILTGCLGVHPGLSRAVVFGPDSAMLTNPYLPVKINTSALYYGYGPAEAYYSSHTRIFDAVGYDVVDSVQCLKANMISTNGMFLSMWWAQDTEGNVWMLKISVREYDCEEDDADMLTSVFGKDNPVLQMPAAPVIDQTVQDFRPYFGENTGYCIVKEIGVPITTPVGTFADCLRLECQNDPGDYDNQYYASGLGLVKEPHEDNPLEDPRGWELVEIIRAGCPGDFDNNGVVDGFDLATFAVQFANTCAVQTGE